MVEVLTDGYGDYPNVLHYAEQVTELYRRRRMIQLAGRLNEAAYNESIPVGELLGEHMGAIEKLASGGASENCVDAADCLRELPSQWQKPNQRIETGMPAIDLAHALPNFDPLNLIKRPGLYAAKGPKFMQFLFFAVEYPAAQAVCEHKTGKDAIKTNNE